MVTTSSKAQGATKSKPPDICRKCQADRNALREMLVDPGVDGRNSENQDMAICMIENCPECKAVFTKKRCGICGQTDSLELDPVDNLYYCHDKSACIRRRCNQIGGIPAALKLWNPPADIGQFNPEAAFGVCHDRIVENIDLLQEITYEAYAYNRKKSPHIPAQNWAVVFPRWESYEERLTLEVVSHAG